MPQQRSAASAPTPSHQEAEAAGAKPSQQADAELEAEPPQQEAPGPEVKAKSHSAAGYEAEPSEQEAVQPEAKPGQGSSQQGSSGRGMAAATDPDSGEQIGCLDMDLHVQGVNKISSCLCWLPW